MVVAGGDLKMLSWPAERDGGEYMPGSVDVPGDFVPGSVRDMLQISVFDTTVTVFGTVIPGFEMEFAR